MKLKPMRLRGKGALLTNGARGIGPAISLGLTREGAKIEGLNVSLDD